MMKRFVGIGIAAMWLAGCGLDTGSEYWQEYDGTNPFLDSQSTDKEDTGYLNMRGVELEVTLEADIEASSYQIFNAPPDLAQFAVTYLKNKSKFYLEILAEDATAPDRVEWLVDGVWLTSAAAQGVERSKLTHFRMPTVNAVVVGDAVRTVTAGQQFVAKVPRKPYSIMSDAGDKCATPDSHIDLSNGVYWYLWNPGKAGCPAELLQDMSVTVERVLENNPPAYPEYDQLTADGRLDVVVVFGRLDDGGDIKDDYNWNTADRFGTWLQEAGFAEQSGAPIGKRYTKQVGELLEVVDVYYPDAFANVADYAGFPNWQRAVTEHEVVLYNGHSVLGTGYAFERVVYPDRYQIFMSASCLSYEYYVRPVLAGKGGWENVDMLSNFEPTYYHENMPLLSALLAKLFWGAENGGRTSWQDIMAAINSKLGHANFGVSGARDNCFTPEGSRCGSDPDPEPRDLRYESRDGAAIPDNAPGLVSTIEVPQHAQIRSLKVELDVQHTYAGDLEITLEHAGTVYALWSNAGGGQDDIVQTFAVSVFNGQDASGLWTLTVRDSAAMDTGTLNGWALVVDAGDGTEPQPEPGRYENSAGADVPDNDPTGIRSTIQVPAGTPVSSLAVEIDLSHTYVGDLEITLSHEGASDTLWARSGGGADDIRQTFHPGVFAGQDAGGSWTLTVIDRARYDTGRLNSWALVINQ